MPLFCKQCTSRRLPKTVMPENRTLWLCENCKNFVDFEDKFHSDESKTGCTISQEIIKNGLKSIPPTDGTKDSFRY